MKTSDRLPFSLGVYPELKPQNGKGLAPKDTSDERVPLTYEPYFCLADQSPYDLVEWKKFHVILRDAKDAVLFEQKDVEAPAFWSERAVRVVAQKYFRGPLGTPQRESSIRQLVGRVVSTIQAWMYEQQYFKTREDVSALGNDLAYLILTQHGTFNSPVWFNLGVEGIPQQASGCFIQSVDDTLESIAELQRNETMVFKRGSGSGTNFSKLRSRKERLSSGGVPSGPVSFMGGLDAWGGVIKSGGTCLAPDQHVYTIEQGPVPVKNLVDIAFHVLSYDPPAGRIKVKRAHAWKSGSKRLVTVVTDKGKFRLSHDHPMKVATGGFVPAGALQAGTRLFAAAIDEQDGRVRVGLRDGKKGRDFLHRLVATDILGINVGGCIVHHKDEDPLNNTPSNLQVMTQAKHAALHGRKSAERGEHIFTREQFGHSGEANGMHRSGTFWNGPKAEAYRAEKARELLDRNPRELQNRAASIRMMNFAWRILEAGGSIDTFEDYYHGRVHYIGRVGVKKQKLLRRIEQRFGSYQGFQQAVNANNHRVIEVLSGEISDVYDVEVKCPTADDKSSISGHNFLLWDGDERFGSGVIVANTRRAAKMCLLDIGHPDIFEYVNCKLVEEKKAQALIAAGYDPHFDAENGAYDSIKFQNANHSVRIPDAFMRKLEYALAHPAEEVTWDLVAVTSGEVVERVPVKALWDAICQAAWQCGDPGLQFDSTHNAWHTCPSDGKLEATNPCGEVSFLNDTSCNLASLNLLKFCQTDGSLDWERFRKAAQIFLIAQEAMVSKSHYPTDKLTENTKKYRPLGLGYTNLGAYLMACGIPYDSDEGRIQAARITSEMTGTAYRTSALLSAAVGPFEAFERNRPAMLKVVKKHRDVAEAQGFCTQVWDEALTLGDRAGFRNAQVTVLAPTGTISFKMDCDTTGCEPEISLYKTKHLVGGGVEIMENRVVGMALKTLDYSEEQRDQLLQYLARNKTLEGSPLEQEHLPVFDCSIPSSGSRVLSLDAHLKMTAALQPFISGSISKTMNVPHHTPVEAMSQAYFDAWKLGIKSVTVYRDGCKMSQPVQTTAQQQTEIGPVRRKLSDHQMNMHRIRIKFGNVKGYMLVTPYEDTGRPGEVFIKLAKEGSTISGLVDGWAQAMSYCLQYGVPLETLVEKFSNTKFEPSGWSKDADIRNATSIYDAVMRKLAAVFLDGKNGNGKTATDIAEIAKASHGTVVALDAPVCDDCGTLMTKTGANCHSCPSCGNSSGCG